MLASCHKLENPSSSLTLGDCPLIMEKCPERSSHSRWTGHLLPCPAGVSAIRNGVRAKERDVWVPCVIVGFFQGGHREEGCCTCFEVWGKQIGRNSSVQKAYIQEGYSSRCSRSSEDISLQTLTKELEVCSYRNQVINALISDRGALSPARQRKGTAGLTGWYGTEFLAIRPWGE